MIEAIVTGQHNNCAHSDVQTEEELGRGCIPDLKDKDGLGLPSN